MKYDPVAISAEWRLYNRDTREKWLRVAVYPEESTEMGKKQ